MDTDKDDTNENSFQFSFNQYEGSTNSFDSDTSFAEQNCNERFFFNSFQAKTRSSPPSDSSHFFVSGKDNNAKFFQRGFNHHLPGKSTSSCFSSVNPFGNNLLNSFNQFSSFTTDEFNANNANSLACSQQKKDYKKSNSSHQTKKQQDEFTKTKIFLERVLSLKDKRTTVMIKNIPNRFTLKSFIAEISLQFHKKYDILYLPVDGENKCNLGFGFINFVDPMTIVSFYDCFYGQKWSRFNSEKRCELSFAKVQGRAQLIKYIERSATTGEETAFIHETIIRSNSELPLKYLQAFLSFHPYASYKLCGFDRFAVESYFNC